MKFLKTQSLGNDFIILEEKNIPIEKNLGELAKKLCARHTGIGADGLLIASPSKKADIQMKIFNADGSIAEMCGNGVRCFATYIYEKNLVKKNRIAIETLAGIIDAEIILDNDKITSIKVNMGKPSYKPAETLSISGSKYQITNISLGNPHAAIFVDKLDENEITKIGPLIENHPSFPKKTNVTFVKIINSHEITAKTWERGVGLTQACGSGACAAVVAAHINNKISRKVTVHLTMGDLFVEWDNNNTVYMTGPPGKTIRKGETPFLT